MPSSSGKKHSLAVFWDCVVTVRFSLVPKTFRLLPQGLLSLQAEVGIIKKVN